MTNKNNFNSISTETINLAQNNIININYADHAIFKNSLISFLKMDININPINSVDTLNLKFLPLTYHHLIKNKNNYILGCSSYIKYAAHDSTKQFVDFLSIKSKHIAFLPLYNYIKVKLPLYIRTTYGGYYSTTEYTQQLNPNVELLYDLSIASTNFNTYMRHAQLNTKKYEIF